MPRAKESHRRHLAKVTRDLQALLKKAHGGLPEKDQVEVIVKVEIEDYLYVVSRVPQAKSEKRLSPRETEIAELVARGLGNKEIAEELTIKSPTVASHLQRVFRKLDIHNRVELAARLKLLS